MANVSYLKASSNANTPYTGIMKKNVPLGQLQGWIAVPKGTKYTLSQFATLVSTLADAARKNAVATRVFPVGPFISFNDKSTDTVTEQTDYGFGEVVRDGTFIWVARTGYGGIGLYRNLRKMHNMQGAYDFIFVYKKGLMLTYAPNLSTGADEAKGVEVSLINVPIWKAAGSNTAEQFNMELQIFDAAQIADNFLFIETDTSPLTYVKGIVQVDIQNGAVWNTSPAGSIDIDLIAAEDSTDNLISTYGSTLNSASLFTCVNDSTSAGITITGVSQVNGKLRIQLDTTDTDYPASGGKVRLYSSSASTWFSAGIEGYETNVLTIARP